MKEEKTIILGEEKVQPHDIDTERTVLATLMRYNELFAQYSDLLCEDLFYFAEEKNIYRCISGVVNAGGITDINSLCDYAIRNNISIPGNSIVDNNDNRTQFIKIFQLSNTVTIEQDIKRLVYLSKQRLCWLILQQTAVKVLDPTLDLDEEVTGCITTLSQIQSEVGDEGIVDFGDALEELRNIVNDNANGVKISLTTGFKLFDDYYLLRPGTLTVLAAFTGVGKSALAMNITINVSSQQIPCAYYSKEMSKAELASRAISKDVQLPASVLMNKRLNEWQMNKFDAAVGAKENLPIYIDERSLVSFDKTIRSIRTVAKTKGVRLVVIDYLQIFAQESDNSESGLAYMARACKNIATETGIALILISQLNRNGEHPNIRMLRGSGQIEESADNIVFIDRPEAYPDNKVTQYEGEFCNESINGTAKLILSKGRGVGTGCSLVGFNGRYTKFYELSDRNEIDNSSQVNMEVPF